MFRKCVQSFEKVEKLIQFIQREKQMFKLTGPHCSIRSDDSCKNWYPKKKYNGREVRAEYFGFRMQGGLDSLNSSDIGLNDCELVSFVYKSLHASESFSSDISFFTVFSAPSGVSSLKTSKKVKKKTYIFLKETCGQGKF